MFHESLTDDILNLIVLLLSVIAVLLVSGCAQTGNVVNTDKETPSGTGQEQTTQPTITPTPTSTQSTELSKTISPEKDVFITVKQIVSFSEKGKYGDEYEYKEGWKMVFVDFEIENNQKTSYSPGLLFTCKIQDKEGYTYDYVVSGGTSPKIDEFSNSNTQPKEKEIVALAFKTPNDFVSHRVICGTYFDMINNNPQYVFEIPSNIIISGTTDNVEVSKIRMKKNMAISLTKMKGKSAHKLSPLSFLIIANKWFLKLHFLIF